MYTEFKKKIPKNKIYSNFFLIIFCLSFIFVFLFSFYYLLSNINTKKQFRDYPEVVATIYEIESTSDGYRVRIEYIIDNEVIQNTYKYYVFTMKVGDEHTIKYNPNNYRDYVTVSHTDNISNIFFSVIGLIAVIVLIKIIISNKKREKLLKSLVGNSKHKVLRIFEFEKINTTRKKMAYNIICFDDETNTGYVSNKRYESPGLLFEIDEKIDLYIDYEDEENFFIDTYNYLKNKRS